MKAWALSFATGQSGSPVIRKDRNVCIAVHVWGDREWNAASTVGGPHGNNLSGLLNVIGKKLPVVKTSNKIKYVKISSAQRGEQDQANEESAAEGAPEGAEKGVAGVLAKFFGAAVGGFLGQQSADSLEASPFIGSFGTPMVSVTNSELSSLAATENDYRRSWQVASLPFSRTHPSPEKS